MRSLGLIGVILVLGVGYFVLQRSATTGTDRGSPQEQIDVVSIRQRLLVIGQAERQYLASHGVYGTLDQLAQEDLLPGGADERGYVFTAQVSGSRQFSITATPVDPQKAEWPTLEVDESLRLTER
jgi:hypothetical protein